MVPNDVHENAWPVVTHTFRHAKRSKYTAISGLIPKYPDTVIPT